MRGARTLALVLWLAVTARATDWPMYRGRPALTGVAQGTLPAKLSLLWTFKTQRPVRSSAAIVDNRVFIGSDDGHLYALDFSTGKPIWAFKTDGPVDSSPLVLDGRVFVGSVDTYLYALDAATGKLLWKYKTDDKILASPNWFRLGNSQSSPPWEGNSKSGTNQNLDDILHAPTPPPIPAGERQAKSEISLTRMNLPASTLDSGEGNSKSILIGSYDFKLHCVDAATGKSNWVYESSNFVNGTAAVKDGQAVFGGCDGVLHIISLADGSQKGSNDIGSPIAASVGLADGRAYFGHYDNQFVCADLKRGTNIWAFRDREFPFFSSPALINNVVIFGGRDKMLHCVKRADGQTVWSFAARGKVDSSPVVCGDKVIVGSDDGRIYLVRLNDGKELWSYEVGQPVEGSPAVAGEKVVIGSDDGNVYCFGEHKK